MSKDAKKAARKKASARVYSYDEEGKETVTEHQGNTISKAETEQVISGSFTSKPAHLAFAVGFDEGQGESFGARTMIIPTKKEMKQMSKKEFIACIKAMHNAYLELDKEYTEHTRVTAVELGGLYRELHRRKAADAERLVTIKKLAHTSSHDAVFFSDTVKFLLDQLENNTPKPSTRPDMPGEMANETDCESGIRRTVANGLFGRNRNKAV